MDIKDIEVLIECKRLVQAMLREKKYTLDRLHENGKCDEKAIQCIEAQIFRMENALQGKPPISFYSKLGKM
jgi:hypothetical protein